MNMSGLTRRRLTASGCAQCVSTASLLNSNHIHQIGKSAYYCRHSKQAAAPAYTTRLLCTYLYVGKLSSSHFSQQHTHTDCAIAMPLHSQEAKVITFSAWFSNGFSNAFRYSFHIGFGLVYNDCVPLRHEGNMNNHRLPRDFLHL